MSNEKCNGYSNYDTWLVLVWLNNDENNYRRLEHLYKGIGTSRKLEDLSCCELMSTLKRYNYGDSIDWHNVNMEEVKETLLRDFSEDFG